jgi:hypothetical protein
MLKKILMIDFSMKLDTALQLGTDMQTDSTAFHRHYNWTQSDKKENINCHRFAFLKISKIRFAAHLPAPAHGLTPAQAKELQSCQRLFFYICFLYWNNLKIPKRVRK